VALGRAIVRQPKAFLFDEPLSNLDAKMRVETRAEITKLHRRLDSTMIYVTHDQVEAMTMADRIVVMRNGLVQQIDEPINLYNNPNNLFVASFIGSPPMNFIHGQMVKRDRKVLFEELDVDGKPTHIHIAVSDEQARQLESYENKKVVFGIRPEDVEEKSVADDRDPGHVFSASLEHLEPMGAETYLYLKTAKSNLIVRSKEFAAKKEIGHDIELSVSIDEARFFDAETENLIV
jgi:multiple sugar transport system ATP-binding protein